MADAAPRPGGRKLVKRRTGSASPSRRAPSGSRLSQQDTPAVPPIDLEATPMPQETGTSPGKEKRSKWRLSNPFHAKEKDRKDSVAVAAGEPTPAPLRTSDTAERSSAARDSATAGDSAYFSSEHVNSSNNTSGNPSFSSAERRHSRGEQLQAPTATLQPPSVTPPTPSASGSPSHATQLPPQPSPSVQAQTDDVHRESYTDHRTGNVVVTTTTVSSTRLPTVPAMHNLTSLTDHHHNHYNNRARWIYNSAATCRPRRLHISSSQRDRNLWP